MSCDSVGSKDTSTDPDWWYNEYTVFARHRGSDHVTLMLEIAKMPCATFYAKRPLLRGDTPYYRKKLDEELRDYEKKNLELAAIEKAIERFDREWSYWHERRTIKPWIQASPKEEPQWAS